MIPTLRAMREAPRYTSVAFQRQIKIDQMAERHLQRPWDPSPKCQTRQERRGQAEVFLDEKSADNGGQRRNTSCEIYH